MAKNKKNGFTLVELIATIALIAILSVVILVNMVGIKTTEDNKNTERFENSIADAACSYIELLNKYSFRDSCKKAANGCTIYLSTLLQSDVALIDGNEVDPKTNKKAIDVKNCIFVEVKWVKVSSGSTYKKKVCETKRGTACQ